MSDTGRFVRRNRVDERYAVAIGSLGGIVAALAGARPTDATVVDVILVAATVGAVVWASASAAWWVTATACGIAAVVAFDPLLAIVGAAAFVAALTIGVRRRESSVLRAVLGAVAMNVLIRSELGGFLGLSAIVGVGVGVFLFVMGVWRRPSDVRRSAWIVAGAVGGVAVVAMVGLAVAGIAARPDMSEGSTLALRAIATLDTGDYQTAADEFSLASMSFDRADDRLGGLLALPSRLVPGVAQNVRAGAELSAEAAAGTEVAAEALRTIDPSSLTVVEGAIDLGAVAAVQDPLVEVRDALVGLRAVSEGVESPWLLAPLQDELADLDERLDDNEPRLDNAIDAVRLAPQMLGADGERRYLILFTTPAEARGLGGFSGNYAEVTVDDGTIDVTRFGRTTDMNVIARNNTARCDDCPEEYVARYGRTGLTNGPDGAVGQAPWSNLTFGAHFPYIGETAQVLYPQSGGSPIDGVFVMDPYVVEALLQYTGPIDVPELDVTVQPADAAEFILRDQYVIAQDKGVRVEALETLGTSAIEALLTGSLPTPADLARDLGPLVTERRLLFWTDDRDEQDLLARTGLIGAIPEYGDDGGFSVSVNNSGESKIDIYLDRDVQASVETADDGTRRLIADVALTNSAPSSGLPPYVIGNNYGLPYGTNRMYLTFYGPPGLIVATRDGESIDLTPMSEAGWIGYGIDDVIASGETVEFHLEFQLEPTDRAAASGSSNAPGEPVIWWQPLAERRP